MIDKPTPTEVELTNGLTNLVVALCEELKKRMPAHEAKAKVAAVLDKYSLDLQPQDKEGNQT